MGESKKTGRLGERTSRPDHSASRSTNPLRREPSIIVYPEQPRPNDAKPSDQPGPAAANHAQPHTQNGIRRRAPAAGPPRPPSPPLSLLAPSDATSDEVLTQLDFGREGGRRDSVSTVYRTGEVLPDTPGLHGDPEAHVAQCATISTCLTFHQGLIGMLVATAKVFATAEEHGSFLSKQTVLAFQLVAVRRAFNKESVYVRHLNAHPGRAAAKWWMKHARLQNHTMA